MTRRAARLDVHRPTFHQAIGQDVIAVILRLEALAQLSVLAFKFRNAFERVAKGHCLANAVPT
jgi:hypothetical protein